MTTVSNPSQETIALHTYTVRATRMVYLVLDITMHTPFWNCHMIIKKVERKWFRLVCRTFKMARNGYNFISSLLGLVCWQIVNNVLPMRHV